MKVMLVNSIAFVICVILSSCGTDTEDEPVLRNAPDKSFLGFHLNKPINLPPCLSKTDDVERTCIKGDFIYLQPDEIPNFMEGNAVFISTTKNASLKDGPQYIGITTKFDESETVLASLRGKYGAEDKRFKSEDSTDEPSPVWYWTFLDLEVQHMNYDVEEHHFIGVFTKNYSRERAAQAQKDDLERLKKQAKKRSL